jgi:hypothetical protein
LIDIAFTTEAEKEPEQTFVIDEDFEDDEPSSVHWPSFVDFDKTEQKKIKTFFKDTPRKSSKTENIKTFLRRFSKDKSVTPKISNHTAESNNATKDLDIPENTPDNK